MANGVYIVGAAAAEDVWDRNGVANDNANTYATIGKYSGSISRYHFRFPIDIPAGATIDSAYMYIYNELAMAGTPGTPSLNLLDQNNAPDFSSASPDPYNRALATGGGASVSWTGFPTAATTWGKSPDIKSQIQYFIDGHCAGGGYAAGQYIGFSLTADGAADNNYYRVLQSQYSSGSQEFAPFLIINWTLAGVHKCVSVPIATSDDDTYNKAADTTDDRTSEVFCEIGGESATILCRSFFRWVIGVPYNSTVDAAQMVMNAGNSAAGAGFSAAIQALDDESTFAGRGDGVYARAVIGSTVTTWAIAALAWANKKILISPDIAARVADRVTQAGYDNTAYLGIRIANGDGNDKNEFRYIASIDAGADYLPPTIVIVYNLNAYTETAAVNDKVSVVLAILAVDTLTAAINDKATVAAALVEDNVNTFPVNDKVSVVAAIIQGHVLTAAVNDKVSIVMSEEYTPYEGGTEYTETAAVNDKVSIVAANIWEHSDAAEINDKVLVVQALIQGHVLAAGINDKVSVATSILEDNVNTANINDKVAVGTTLVWDYVFPEDIKDKVSVVASHIWEHSDTSSVNDKVSVLMAEVIPGEEDFIVNDKVHTNTVLVSPVVSYSIPTGYAFPYGMCVGPDGNMWFVETGVNAMGIHTYGKLCKITTAGVITEYDLYEEDTDSQPNQIVVGPDGNFWITEGLTNCISSWDTSGNLVHRYTMPTSESQPRGICVGPDENIWFTEFLGQHIGRLRLYDGQIDEWDCPLEDWSPFGITTGADGRLWFTGGYANYIGAYDPVLDEMNSFPVTLDFDAVAIIIRGPDDRCWFTCYGDGTVGAIDILGQVTLYPLDWSMSPPTEQHIYPPNPVFIANGPDGTIWVAAEDGNAVGWINISGPVPVVTYTNAGWTLYTGPWKEGIVVGPDGNVWYADYNAFAGRTDNKITKHPIPPYDPSPAICESLMGGYIGAWYNVHDWNTIRDATYGLTVDSGGDSVYTSGGTNPGEYSHLYRSIMTFDTSKIPGDATIQSASLKIHVSNKYNNAGLTNAEAALSLVYVHMKKPGVISNPDDYENIVFTDLADRIDYDDVVVGENEFILNETGREIIGRGWGAVTELAIAFGADTDDIAPITWVQWATSGYAIKEASDGFGLAPVLTLEYTRNYEEVMAIRDKVAVVAVDEYAHGAVEYTETAEINDKVVVASTSVQDFIATSSIFDKVNVFIDVEHWFADETLVINDKVLVASVIEQTHVLYEAINDKVVVVASLIEDNVNIAAIADKVSVTANNVWEHSDTSAISDKVTIAAINLWTHSETEAINDKVSVATSNIWAVITIVPINDKVAVVIDNIWIHSEIAAINDKVGIIAAIQESDEIAVPIFDRVGVEAWIDEADVIAPAVYDKVSVVATIVEANINTAPINDKILVDAANTQQVELVADVKDKVVVEARSGIYEYVETVDIKDKVSAVATIPVINYVLVSVINDKVSVVASPVYSVILDSSIYDKVKIDAVNIWVHSDILAVLDKVSVLALIGGEAYIEVEAVFDKVSVTVSILAADTLIAAINDKIQVGTTLIHSCLESLNINDKITVVVTFISAEEVVASINDKVGVIASDLERTVLSVTINDKVIAIATNIWDGIVTAQIYDKVWVDIFSNYFDMEIYDKVEVVASYGIPYEEAEAIFDKVSVFALLPPMPKAFHKHGIVRGLRKKGMTKSIIQTGEVEDSIHKEGTTRHIHKDGVVRTIDKDGEI